MQPRTICYVIWSLGLGGAERVVLTLARALDRDRFRPLILCLNDPGPFAPEALEAGIPVQALGKRGPFDVLILRRIMKSLKASQVDLVHTHLFTANTWGRIAARLASVPVVITEHNVDVWKRWYHRVIDRRLASSAHTVVAVSDEVARFYADWAVPRDRILTIYNGVEEPPPTPPAELEALRAKLGVAPSDLVVGWIGRMVPAKDLDNLLDAFERLPGEAGEAKLLLVGDGPERARLEQRVATSPRRESIIFAGFQRAARRFYELMDVVVLSSTREGHPVVALEAMAAGKPVVATRVGGVPEVIVDGETGWVVPPRDPAQLADKLGWLLSRPDERRRQGQAARQRVHQEFSLASMVRQHEDLYSRVLAPPGP